MGFSYILVSVIKSIKEIKIMRFSILFVFFVVFIACALIHPCFSGAENNIDDFLKSQEAENIRKRVLSQPPTSAHEKVVSDPNAEFLEKTISTFLENCEGKVGIDYLNCWADNSPKKCKSLVYGKDRSAWSRCVFSCGSEGVFSKTFGDCAN
jgi:hypothetical protein